MYATPEETEDTATATLATPLWMRIAHASKLKSASVEIAKEAIRTGEQEGVIADRRIRSILAEADTSRSTGPSAATIAAYRRDHALLMEDETTPLEKATTFQHHNRLRSAFRYCEAEIIRGLRLEAEQARKGKRYEEMRLLTLAAFERATIFDALFLSVDRPTWGKKASSIRASGEVIEGKSKRAAGRSAPSPDQLLVAIGNQKGRSGRVEIMAACFALFGIRPAELKKGAELFLSGDGVGVVIKGAKVDAVRGQVSRRLSVSASSVGRSGLAVKVLRGAVEAGLGLVSMTDADLAAVRRAMRQVQTGLSPYAFRHARASDAKASKDRAVVAAWMGHSSDRTQSYYGNGRSSSGAVSVEAAVASGPVRAVKTLPQSLAQRLVKGEALRHSKMAGRTGPRSAPTPKVKIKGPRMR